MNWPPEIRVSVNLSAGQFKGNQPLAAVERALLASGLPASRLELEITETVLAHNEEHTIRALHELRALGARIVMDDFGTGNSSLNHLRTFPFERIKIDRSFIRDVAANTGAAAIIRAVTGLGKGLNLSVIAEGVETAEQLTVLRACECTRMQGFLFSRPVPLSETRALASSGIRMEPRQAETPEDELLSRLPWKPPPHSSETAGDRVPVQVPGDGDVFDRESI
jgi:EAL domain-containing protein (putative c-di-GMP-specific phosphodiesterase class I)